MKTIKTVIWSISTFYLLGRPPSWIDPLLLDNPPSPLNGSPPPIEETLLLGPAPVELLPVVVGPFSLTLVEGGSWDLRIM